MLRKIVMAIFVLAASAAHAQTRRVDVPVFGAGLQKCEDATKSDALERSRAWIAGYLTAFGESFATPAIWMGDPTTVDVIFNETCAAFPKFTLSEAAHWIILTLQDRRYNKK